MKTYTFVCLTQKFFDENTIVCEISQDRGASWIPFTTVTSGEYLNNGFPQPWKFAQVVNSDLKDYLRYYGSNTLVTYQGIDADNDKFRVYSPQEFYINYILLKFNGYAACPADVTAEVCL